MGDEGRATSGGGAIVNDVFTGVGRDGGWESEVDDPDLALVDRFFRRGASEDGVSDEESEREGREAM